MTPETLKLGLLRLKHEEIEEAKEKGIDLIDIKQKEITGKLEQMGYKNISFVPRHTPPSYVIFEEYPSTNFWIVGEKDV